MKRMLLEYKQNLEILCNQTEKIILPKAENAFVITNPMIAANKSAEVTLSKFLRVLKPCYGKLTVIGGNLSVEADLKDIELISFDILRAGNKIKRALDILKVQLKMCKVVKRLIQKNDTVFFWIGDKMILPYKAAKKAGAEINYFIYGNVAKEGSVSRFAEISSNLIRYMAAHADYVCMESRSVADEWEGLTAAKIRVIHLYTDNIAMNPFENREKTIGMLCRLTAGKHVLESIEAFSKVHEKYPDWKLEIIGSGRQQQECEQLINELNAGGYINLLGWVDHNVIVEKSKKWKYLLFPTDTEGMPNGLLEMMGRGIPALASPVGGIKDIVTDKKNGFILPDCRTETIVSHLIEIIGLDEVSYRKCSEETFNTVTEEYSLAGAMRNARLVLGVGK